MLEMDPKEVDDLVRIVMNQVPSINVDVQTVQQVLIECNGDVINTISTLMNQGTRLENDNHVYERSENEKWKQIRQAFDERDECIHARFKQARSTQKHCR
jgi:predicted GTPase